MTPIEVFVRQKELLEVLLRQLLSAETEMRMEIWRWESSKLQDLRTKRFAAVTTESRL